MQLEKTAQRLLKGNVSTSIRPKNNKRIFTVLFHRSNQRAVQGSSSKLAISGILQINEINSSFFSYETATSGRLCHKLM